MSDNGIEQELLLPMDPNDSDLECGYGWGSDEEDDMQVRRPLSPNPVEIESDGDRSVADNAPLQSLRFDGRNPRNSWWHKLEFVHSHLKVTFPVGRGKTEN